MQHPGPRGRDGGFTLIEVALTTVIIGLAVAVLMTALAAGTRTNAQGQEMSDAILLAQEIREWTLRLPFSDGRPVGTNGSNPQFVVNDLDDLHGVAYAPPRDGRGEALGEYPGWGQDIVIAWLDPDDFERQVNPGTTNLVRVEVTVTRNARPVLTTSWLVAREMP